ncbi:hypothetical protein [Bacillus sp. FJAT-42315]|uniref:hypothetical protein n=1 Tax=Bacillus sp. FJAT-42315 TaxID=2014077 RepID=UPI000C23A8B3|nr:hypothetical protein [Bacillus sp. FJAT-42315]
MQIYSLSSFVFSLIGAMFVGVSFVLENFVEYVFALGLVFLGAGMLVSVGAFRNGDIGWLKWVAVAIFFGVLLLVVLVEPFHFVRLLVWVKNWPVFEMLERMFAGKD